MKKIKPEIYRNEYPEGNGINPGYCDLEHAISLCEDEKRIWLLRGDPDLTIALGIKNDQKDGIKRNGLYTSHFINSSFSEAYFDQFHYGHPTLAMPEGTYDGCGYYGGWIRQHTGSLEILLSTGRFKTPDINPKSREAVEKHIARRMLAKFNSKNILFIDFTPGSLEAFLKDEEVVNGSRRAYTSAQLNPEKLIDIESMMKFDNTQIINI
jgi:hypothetical protein